MSQLISEVVDSEAIGDGYAGGAESGAAPPRLHKSGLDQDIQIIRPGVDGLLDAARIAYSDCMESIRAEAERFGHEWPSCSLHYTKARGFHFIVGHEVGHHELPDGAIQAVKMGKRIHFTTTALAAMNSKLEAAAEQVLCLTDKVLRNLLQGIRAHMEFIFQVRGCQALTMRVPSHRRRAFSRWLRLSRRWMSYAWRRIHTSTNQR